MKKRNCFILSSCFTVLTAGWSTSGVWAQQLPDPIDLGVSYEGLAFEAADTDGNNLVSEGEFVRDAAAGFRALDRDHDGKVALEELGAYGRNRFARVDADGDWL